MRTVIIVGPEAEPSDLQAVAPALRLVYGGIPVILWLCPQSAGPTHILAQAGIRALRAHPFRRAPLLRGVTEPVLQDSGERAPVLTRSTPSMPASAFGNDDAVAAARAEGRIELVAEDKPVNQEGVAPTTRDPRLRMRRRSQRNGRAARARRTALPAAAMRLPYAGDGRLRADAPDPCRRAGRQAAIPDHRHYRQCPARRGGLRAAKPPGMDDYVANDRRKFARCGRCSSCWIAPAQRTGIDLGSTDVGAAAAARTAACCPRLWI